MKSLFRACWCFFLLSLLSCGSKKDGEGTSGSSAKSYSIAVIPKGTTHEFWKSINAGAFKARDELNAQGLKVDTIWKGPLKEDDRDQQIQVVEGFASQGVNGIVLAPLDNRALARPVGTAPICRPQPARHPSMA